MDDEEELNSEVDSVFNFFVERVKGAKSMDAFYSFFDLKEDLDVRKQDGKIYEENGNEGVGKNVCASPDINADLSELDSAALEPVFPSEDDLILNLKEAITTALDDYGRHTTCHAVLESVDISFIDRLAHDSAKSKEKLRQLFRKSDTWNEDLQAIVINGNKTHQPDPIYIKTIIKNILHSAIYKGTLETYTDRDQIIEFFCSLPDTKAEDYGYCQQMALDVIRKYSPRAYAPGKKLSRIFRQLCIDLDIFDPTSGSDFQRDYVKLADELSSKKIDFKLYVSINPAHFLTMSNPIRDERGESLISCHTFNREDYDYNNGCSGYARDENTFIVFTASDPNDPETLNNRKVTRQIFAYEPGNGVLLQSRLYGPTGGTSGETQDFELYRDLIQREISLLEDADNLWKTKPAIEYDMAKLIEVDSDFGGYPDWRYAGNNSKVSIRSDHYSNHKKIHIGASGLCVCCSDTTSATTYCNDCGGFSYCEFCNNRVDEDLYTARDEDGELIEICYDCYLHEFDRCNDCDDLYHRDNLTYVAHNNRNVCPLCLEDDYMICDHCNNYVHKNDVYGVDEAGYRYVCERCYEDDFCSCDDCGGIYENYKMVDIRDKYGEERSVCPKCKHGYDYCYECHSRVEPDDDGLCPKCGNFLRSVGHSDKADERRAI